MTELDELRQGAIPVPRKRLCEVPRSATRCGRNGSPSTGASCAAQSRIARERCGFRTVFARRGGGGVELCFSQESSRRRLSLVAAAAELEQIVRDELRAPVAELVDQVVRDVVRELVHERLNGHRAAPAEAPAALAHTAQTATGREETTVDPPGPQTAPQTPQGTKTCGICGEQKPVSEFDRDRRQCRRCRSDRYSRRPG
jgi:hypothetical protein